MKKFLFMLLALLCTAIGVTTLSSCHSHESADESYFNEADSVEIAKIVEGVLAKAQPVEFKDQHEFLMYVAVKRDAYNLEQIVYGLPDTTLSGIVNLLSKRKEPLCIQTVADEYIKNKPFYDGVSDGMEAYRAESVPKDTSVSYQIVNKLKDGGPKDAE